MKRYLRIWIRLSLSSLQTSFASRLGAVLFVFAKLLRFGFFLLTIFFLMDHTQALAGYRREEVLLLFFTYTIIDSISQLLFREVYRFRAKVVSGDFDFDLVKPMRALFRPLLGGIDVFDAITLAPYIIGLLIILQSFTISPLGFVMYLTLVGNALLIAMSFHIAVLALGILTMQIDHAMMVYRDISSMGRFPLDMYQGIVKGVLTYLVPMGLMVTLPVQVVKGTLSLPLIALSFGLAIIFLSTSLSFWRFSLTRYTSASS